ncbi:hypothetical protein Patl1_25200 [Pistacia atlantica]|uniref:Uncharacterized protein n=1 Tax=Pistacia atlantica TaxID=434234 RepID=A0ACC1B4N1_9ROSI|nr:hypothetical protein Patl1_25200 [Pistacia atlantica]
MKKLSPQDLSLLDWNLDRARSQFSTPVSKHVTSPAIYKSVMLGFNTTRTYKFAPKLKSLSLAGTKFPTVNEEKMSTGELACTYASLILHGDGIVVTPEKIATLLKTANLNIESYWPSLFSKLCEKRSIEDLILNVGSGGASVAVAAPAAATGGGGGGGAPAAAVEEKKEEPKEESDDDMGFSLFD